MYGVDVGSLRWLVSSAAGERVVWSLVGDAGNAWFRGAVTLAEPQPFRVVVEAAVGAVGMSDIAVDNISLDPGPCPVSPQVAGAKAPGAPGRAGAQLQPVRRSPRMPPDCSMEVDECGWRPMAQPSRWSRLPVATLPPSMQRKPHGPGDGAQSGAGLRNDFFLGLQMPASLAGSSPAATTTLVSLPITSRSEPLCLAFWYLVHEPSAAGAMSTGLGALRVVLREARDDREVRTEEAPRAALQSATVWALYNTQGPAWRPARVPLPANFTFTVELEGEWGPGKHSGILAVDDIVLYHAKCPGVPSSALSSPADCSFSSDSCTWTNGSGSTGRSPGWQHASGQHRPARLSDNTFRAPGGYVFFDMFSLSKVLRRARLESPHLDAGEPVCLSFWFAAFGQGDSTMLRVLRVDQDRKLPEMTVWQLNARGLDTARPTWMSAQATVSANTAFSIVLEGVANNGGFAVDDVRVRPGVCQTRPVNAQPTSTES
ncbi:MAM and LDL-receptor class A domain-containing protein 1-like [Frankliniella occidentalis]|uniref:MAM and LDL-receptor class A domain-containing protein 1-like n=1 Tax=Frankliniella occidentalis TaxID=133901 RepID=A0A9C6WLJ4_FRAOC|nr:MAM and LDL-receptor class A domain-containing protein 1-like [Frankliniella occidentalis]